MTDAGHCRLKQVVRRREKMLDFLRTLVNTDSPSTEPELTSKISRMVGDKCRQLGACVKYIKAEGAGDHLKAVWNPGGDFDERLLLLCHLDTVWPEGETDKRPFELDGDRATGPGIFDMKAGVVQALFAVEVLSESGQMPDRPVVLFCNTDEEIGSDTSRDIIENLAQQSACTLVLEPSIPPDGALKTARKGVGRFTVTTYGTAAHSGADHRQGISAIEEMARQVQYLHSLTDYDRGTTVNVGVIEGGSRSNVVAEQCTAEVDLRVTTPEEGKQMEKVIMGLKPKLSGARVKVTGGLNRPPMQRTEQIAQMFEKARQIGEELGLKIVEDSTGGASDGNFTAALGVPTIDGLGAVGAGGHARDEWISIKKMIQRTALLAELIRKL